MAQAVVDQLEVIEIEIHHRYAAAVAARLGDGVDHAVAEEEPVRQTGERVVVGLILELLLGCLPLRDVAIVEDDGADARVMQHVLRERLQPDPHPVPVSKAQFALRLRRYSGGERAQHLAHRLAFARVDIGEEARAEQIVFAVAEQALGRGAAVMEGQLAAQQGHAAPALLHQRTEALLAFLELRLRALALRDVAQKCREGLIGAASDRLDRQLDRELLAVRAPRGGFDAAPGPRVVADGVEELRDLRRQRMAQNVWRPKAERGLGLRIPLDDDAGAVDAEDRVEGRVDELFETRLRFAPRRFRVRALNRLAEKTGGRLEERDLVVGERPLPAGVGEEHPEDP